MCICGLCGCVFACVPRCASVCLGVSRCAASCDMEFPACLLSEMGAMAVTLHRCCSPAFVPSAPPLVSLVGQHIEANSDTSVMPTILIGSSILDVSLGHQPSEGISPMHRRYPSHTAMSLGRHLSARQHTCNGYCDRACAAWWAAHQGQQLLFSAILTTDSIPNAAIRFLWADTTQSAVVPQL